jgi:hypothetical protein
MCFYIGKFVILNEAERNERDEKGAKLFFYILMIMFDFFLKIL